jgi:gamma-glutamyltranspeptidase/glutathione hydrolase
VVVLSAWVRPALAVAPAPLRAEKAAVASDHEAASRAGAAALRAGGNAADAACATAMALGVTIPHSSGIGGGGFALVYLAKEKKVYALDFRETAPAAIKPEMFFTDGKPDPKLSRGGGLAVAVPGEVKGLSTMVSRWGRLGFSRCVQAAERLARGVPANDRVAWMVNEVGGDAAFIKDVFAFKAPVKPGDIVRRPSLHRTLAILRARGADAFYRGPIARDIVETVRAAGGVMTEDDLANYQVKDRTPLELAYRGQRIFAMPPPSSGGLVIATALGILEKKVPDSRSMAELGAGSSAYLHLLVEALKHGFADRARHLGDTDFVEVPLERLLSPAYHAELAARIKPEGVLPQAGYGTPGAEPAPVQDGGTAHLSVIDAEGNAVALTTTVNLWFGARIVTKSGIVLNNEMDDFAMKPGVENAFRLLGTERNAVAPRKRPLSSMSPTLVIDDDGVRLAVGGAGGPTIISGTLQVMLNVLDFGMDAQEASAAPRVHHQWMPDQILAEPQIAVDVVKNLERRGHKVVKRDELTKVNVVARVKRDKPGTRELEAAAELRSGGVPAGF